MSRRPLLARFRRRAIAFALAACALAACDFRRASRGVVVGLSGEPIEGATVSMRSSCGSRRACSSTVTGPDGAYTVVCVTAFPGEATAGVEIAKDGFEPRCIQRTVGSRADLDPIRIELVPARAEAR